MLNITKASVSWMWGNWYSASWTKDAGKLILLTINTKNSAGTGRDILAHISLAYYNIKNGSPAADAWVYSYKDDNNWATYKPEDPGAIYDSHSPVRQIMKCREVHFALDLYGPIETRCAIWVGFAT
jgi:hypothetical protein